MPPSFASLVHDVVRPLEREAREAEPAERPQRGDAGGQRQRAERRRRIADNSSSPRGRARSRTARPSAGRGGRGPRSGIPQGRRRSGPAAGRLTASRRSLVESQRLVHFEHAQSIRARHCGRRRANRGRVEQIDRRLEPIAAARHGPRSAMPHSSSCCSRFQTAAREIESAAASSSPECSCAVREQAQQFDAAAHRAILARRETARA